MVCQDAADDRILQGLVHPIQNQHACHAQVCNPLLQQTQVEAGREEEDSLLLELRGIVLPAGLAAVPASDGVILIPAMFDCLQ